VRRWPQSLLARARRLWQLAKGERASPTQIAIAVAVGTMACMAPVFGVHLWISLVCASALRVNRMWAAWASQVPSMFGLLRAPIVLAEVELGSRLLTGAWLEVETRDALQLARHLYIYWCAGAAILATILALVLGSAAYVWARRLRPRTPASPRPPSSEFPPSVPPAPSR